MSLEHFLKQQIAQQGPVTVAEFMQLALMHPQYGYYQKQQPFGREGDFTTAPEISQMFGEMVGVWVASIWQQLGSPKSWTLVELGPGRGILMHDILRATRHVEGLHESLSILFIEQSNALKEKQKKAVDGWSCDKAWQETSDQLPSEPTIIVANEFFDALPIHQYIKKEDGFYEHVIGLDQYEKLQFQLSTLPVNLPAEAMRANRLNMDDVIECSPVSNHVMEQLARHISTHGGAGLFIDYGYEMPAVGDTLQALKDHHYHALLEDIGMADITAHVNFTALSKAAKHAGSQQQHIQSQADFLTQMGIKLRAETLIQRADAKQQEQVRSALHRLTHSDEMGELFKVLMIA